MTAPPRPSIYNLQRFLLGTLPPAEAAQVAAWVESSPEAPLALAGIAAHDALTKAVASTVGVTAPPAPVVERVVRNVTTGPQTVPRTGPPPLPDVAQPTQPSGAPRPASTGDWRSPSGAAPGRFGPFRVVRELGRGGMGVVYEAVDESLGRHAAVKVLSPDLAANDEARRRFLREGSAAADLKSDHVVTIYQVGEEAGVPFLAMEFIEGPPLETWLQSRPSPVTAGEVLWVARDLLAGLDAAHKKGRIHRDIKPANAMVERDTRRVKILDFGLTRAVDGAEQLTRANAVLGTPEYMSPEQARGEKLDARTDLFSVGVVLYRMVLGRSPFRRDGLMPTLYAVVHEPPPALTGLPRELSAFVARLMSPKREDRPADAGAALAELRVVEARLSTPLELEPAPPPRRKSRVLLAAVAVALLAAVVVIIIRDKDGKKVATVEVSADKVKGGKVEVIGPNGEKKSVAIPPGKDDKVEPKPLEVLGPMTVGSRVKVTINTRGYADYSSQDVLIESVNRGTRGTIMKLPKEGRSRCFVRLDTLKQEEVWLLLSELEAE